MCPKCYSYNHGEDEEMAAIAFAGIILDRLNWRSATPLQITIGQQEKPEMKPRIAIVLGAIFALAIAVPAFAQYSDTPYPAGFADNYPWFTNDAQSQSFQQFLASDPQDEQELAPNPQMIYDDNWRMQHPQVQSFMQANPDVWNWLLGFGAQDNRNQWHDAYWWHQNNRQWFYANHPQWVGFDPQWQNQDGDYDNQHSWHDAYWWHQNNRDWFYSNHPEWISYDSQWQNQDGAFDQQRNWH
jgi:hypothetical protein